MVDKAPMRVQHKRMTKAQWQSSAVILLQGEIGVESDTGYIKVGDGTNRFSALKYLTGPKGDKGDAFKYTDFTPDQLASLKGQKGDPLRFEDLTQEQINQLKGQKGDPLRFEDLTPEQINQLKAADIDLSKYATEEFVNNAVSSVDVSSQLTGKADVGHRHKIDEVEHLRSNIDSFTESISGLRDMITSHRHQIDDVTGLREAIDTKADIPSLDTRSAESNPAFYMENYGKKTIREFKFRYAVGNPPLEAMTHSGYALITTIVPWTDGSGGYPVQITYGAKQMAIRQAVSDTAWGSWVTFVSQTDLNSKGYLTETIANNNYASKQELQEIQLTPGPPGEQGPPGTSVTVEVVSSPPSDQAPNVLYLVRA